MTWHILESPPRLSFYRYIKHKVPDESVCLFRLFIYIFVKNHCRNVIGYWAFNRIPETFPSKATFKLMIPNANMHAHAHKWLVVIECSSRLDNLGSSIVVRAVRGRAGGTTGSRESRCTVHVKSHFRALQRQTWRTCPPFPPPSHIRKMTDVVLILRSFLISQNLIFQCQHYSTAKWIFLYLFQKTLLLSLKNVPDLKIEYML